MKARSGAMSYGKIQALQSYLTEIYVNFRFIVKLLVFLTTFYLNAIPKKTYRNSFANDIILLSR